MLATIEKKRAVVGINSIAKSNVELFAIVSRLSEKNMGFVK